MKSGSRVATLVRVGGIKGICVFRGTFLEHLFLGYEELEEEFKRSRISREVNFSNLGIGSQYSGELIQECERIVGLITEKLKKGEEIK